MIPGIAPMLVGKPAQQKNLYAVVLEIDENESPSVIGWSNGEDEEFDNIGGFLANEEISGIPVNGIVNMAEATEDPNEFYWAIMIILKDLEDFDVVIEKSIFVDGEEFLINRVLSFIFASPISYPQEQRIFQPDTWYNVELGDRIKPFPTVTLTATAFGTIIGYDVIGLGSISDQFGLSVGYLTGLYYNSSSSQFEMYVGNIIGQVPPSGDLWVDGVKQPMAVPWTLDGHLYVATFTPTGGKIFEDGKLYTIGFE